MKKILLVAVSVVSLFGSNLSHAADPIPDDVYRFYRELIQKVRTTGTFKIPRPGGPDEIYSYDVKWGEPKFEKPIIAELPSGKGPGKFYREFYDKFFFLDGSELDLGNEKLPITCIHVSGQDNRYSGETSPLFPKFVMKIYLVANDFSCAGPIRSGWPSTGGKKEAWDTYVYYEIRDPTIMLPTEAKLRYRWNEYEAVLVK